MSDRDGLGAVALYNPQLLSEHELRRHFVARSTELAELLAELRSRRDATPQHRLVLGQRGMGKTTLLHRLAGEITRDPELAGTYIPLLFPQEQYNIRHLGDLWVNSLDALADYLERTGDVEGAAEIDAIIRDLPLDDLQVLEEDARHALVDHARVRDRRMLLLLDNADMVFSRVEGGDWALRRALQADSEIVVVAASATPMESTYQYDAAFFDFFATMRLDGLGEDDARELLLTLAAERGSRGVQQLVTEHPERVEPIRMLSGGNPRTLVALYDVLEADSGSLRTDLHVLLDRYTPLFKAQFDALSPQAQTIVDALCLHWDPATAADLADRTGHGVNKVSAQLDRLVSSGLVSKGRAVDFETGVARRRNAFRVTDRFFNIWYLLRGSRRERRRLEDLVAVLGAIASSAESEEVPMRVLEEAHDLEPYVAGFLYAVPRLVSASSAATVRDQLEARGLAGRLRPVHAALHTWALDEPHALEALAPEVGQASRMLLEQWRADD